MELQVNKGLILKVQKRDFKTKDGKEVEYYVASFIDDTNNYHEATVLKDVAESIPQGYDGIDRTPAILTVNLEEINTPQGDVRVKKKIVNIEF